MGQKDVLTKILAAVGIGDGTWTRFTRQGQGDLTADPLFRQGWPDLSAPPLAGSPALMAGTSDGAPLNDLVRFLRNAQPTIGAFEQ